MTYLMIVAGVFTCGMFLGGVGVGIQIVGLIGVLFLGLTGQWGM